MPENGRCIPVLRGGDEYAEPRLGDDLDAVLRGIRDELRTENDARGARPARVSERERALLAQRGGSRFAAPGATDDVLDTLAAGGAVQVRDPLPRGGAGGSQRGGLAYAMKALAEATGSAGGYLVPPEISAEVLG